MKTNFAKVFTARHHDLCKLSYQEILGFIIAKKVEYSIGTQSSSEYKKAIKVN